MTRPRILIIDDQFTRSPDLRAELCDRLGLVDVALTASDAELELLPDDAVAAVFCSGQIERGDRIANDLALILDHVGRGWPASEGWRWALIMLDVRFDSVPPSRSDAGFGLHVLQHLVETWPDRAAAPGNAELPLIMLSSIERSRRARDANRAGARAYIEKSALDRPGLQHLLDEHGLVEDHVAWGRPPSSLLLGRSLPTLQMLREARRVARIQGRGNAMILGPQGCGKTSLASYIHAASQRSGRLAHYYASPALEQIEYASLFGCWQGVYTGQRKESYPGVAELAHQGTLLIDEVHNLKPISQAELLEFARLDPQHRRWVTRLGKTPPSRPRDALQQARRSVLGTLDTETSKIAVDVLLLTASSEEVHETGWRTEHGFSDPLYTRLGVEYVGRPLLLPGLAARRHDIPVLFRAFLARDASIEVPLELDEETLELLLRYPWPGNVAELQGVASYAAQASQGFETIYARHLPPRLAQRPWSNQRSKEAGGSPPFAERSSPTSRPPHADIHLEEVLANFMAEPSAVELHGRLASMQEAYGGVVQRLLEAALEATRNRTGVSRNQTLGDLVPTRAIKLLLGRRKMTTAQAASEILRLARMFVHEPEPNSDLDRVLVWARDLRGGATRR
ncbi:MAG: sigma 54-interacting transcriptional regulator [Myxococcota bacterium]